MSPAADHPSSVLEDVAEAVADVNVVVGSNSAPAAVSEPAAVVGAHCPSL